MNKDYFFLNFSMACFVKSLKTNLPLIFALSIKSSSQCAVSFQNIFFISAIAWGDEWAKVFDNLKIASSIFSILSCTSLNNPLSFAQSLLRHMVASIASALKAAVPILRSTAGPTTKGLDFKAMLDYGRTVGNPALRKMTFHARGNMLKALALHLQKHLPTFYEISYKTGATKADSWVDIEGGIGNLFANASLRRKFPDDVICIDGESHNLSKNNTFMGTHILSPKEGVAVHINAFNFPVWGMLEKIAVNLLAGMPAIVKPASVTSYLTEAVVKEIIASNILPKGALQLICGSAGDLLNHVTSQDVVTFTGSATTGLLLKSKPFVVVLKIGSPVIALYKSCPSPSPLIQLPVM